VVSNSVKLGEESVSGVGQPHSRVLTLDEQFPESRYRSLASYKMLHVSAGAWVSVLGHLLLTKSRRSSGNQAVIATAFIG
jgi:hypothetical protein